MCDFDGIPGNSWGLFLKDCSRSFLPEVFKESDVILKIGVEFRSAAYKASILPIVQSFQVLKHSPFLRKKIQ